MRVLATIALLLGVSSGAFAQQAAPEEQAAPQEQAAPATIVASIGCWPVTSRERVVVTMENGPARRGTLLCMGPEEIMLTGSGPLPLSTIRQISKPRDSYLDGMLKGAAIGLVILVFCAPDCPAEYVMRSTIAYATIGGVIDGLQGNNKTIYRREPRAAFAWTVRF